MQDFTNAWFFIIIIIIIKACRQHGFNWLYRYPYLSTIFLGKSSRLHPVSAQSWWMKVFADRPTLVCPYIGVHRRTFLMSSFSLYPLVCFTDLWFVRWEISGLPVAFLCDAASKIGLKQHAESFCSSHLAFSPNVFLESTWCNHTILLTRLPLWRISFFLSSFCIVF